MTDETIKEISAHLVAHGIQLKAQFEEIRTLRAEIDELRAGKAEHEEEIKILKADKANLHSLLQITTSKGGKTSSACLDRLNAVTDITPGEVITSTAKMWRALGTVGGSLCTLFALYGFLGNDEWWAWAALQLWCFSTICLSSVTLADVRNHRKPTEKAFIVFSGAMTAVGPMLGSFTWMISDDWHTKMWGRVCLGVSIFFCAMPLVAYNITKVVNGLSDEDLSKVLTRLFQSLPGVLVPILYISAAAMRCIMASSHEIPIIHECGNPMFPTLFVSVLLLLTWAVVYVLAPVTKYSHDFTWADLMMLRFNMMEGAQFTLFGILSTLSLLLYSNTDEDGNALSHYIIVLCALFVLFGISLFGLVVFDSIIKPRLQRSTFRDKSATKPQGSFDTNALEGAVM